jgi:hypothetical protein
MIIHIVMWTLKDFAEGKDKSENIHIMKEKLESLIDHVDVIRKLEVGLNFNARAAAYDIVLYSEFDSKEDLNAYQIHPEHRKVSEFIGKIDDKRAVVDYEK